MPRDRLIQFAAALVLAGAILAQLLVAPLIESQRSDLQLGYGSEVGETMTADIAVSTIMLGVFRGLAVSYLWYEANQLKEEGKFYSANEKAELITTLQPRYPMVWAFHAWNMSYNISVATHTPEERWDWVRKGIELLRDEGIPKNPNAVRLYRELGWIFFHKIGAYSDDMHWYYKRQLAAEWHGVMGDQPQAMSEQQVLDRMRRVAEAPDYLVELTEEDPAVNELVLRLDEIGFKPDFDLLQRINMVITFMGTEEAAMLGLGERQFASDRDRRLMALYQQEEFRQAFEKLIAHIRKRVLVDRYHMKPDFMFKLMKPEAEGGYDFGPIDWRHSSAHSMYWSALGIEIAMRLREKDRIDQINTDRQVIHSAQQLMRTGRVIFNPITGTVDFAPDARFVRVYERAVDAAKERIESGEFGAGTKTSLDSGHQNLLLQAMRFAYLYGDVDEAQRLYDKVRRLYGDKRHNRERFRQPLAKLVQDEIQENFATMDDAAAFVDAMLARAFSQGLATGNMSAYARFTEFASQAHEKYHKERTINPTAVQNRMFLRPMKETAINRFGIMIQSPQIPILQRLRAWRNMPDDLRRPIYAQPGLLPAMTEQLRRFGLDPAKAFAAPEGMDAYLEKQQNKTGDTPQNNRGPQIEVQRN